ncbi:hypothetical protein LZD49_32365 [Dyadobacter sp. CY261]|uniref:hypothetical protein n=1 Tax=Dyadobacter sp. CY261 TaxID=2907203 RepID=UPI001F25A237|nr:hypothetical protein [Dyadobacter sp. CY261]MCF0075222.1 hypothetical protein [Dyadobacter sp. CY261]
MSQGFKLRYDQLREGNPARPQPEPEAEPQAEREQPISDHAFYETDGSVRNLCLIWQDGRQILFNYAYLLPAEFYPGRDLNEIILNFSGYLVSLKGYMLEPLFIQLRDHRPRVIQAVDPRYITEGDPRESIVIEIQVAKPE